MKSLIMVGAALVLMGCSAMPVAQQEKTLVAKNVCCSGVKEFDYEPLKQDKDTKFLLDEKSPAYQFGSQKSYFKAFAIETGPDRVLFVKSYFNGMLIGQYLQPIFQFLDSSHQPLGALIPSLRFVEGNMFADNNAHMVGGVRIPEKAGYVVVFTAKFDSTPEAATTRPSVGVFMAGNTPIVTSNPGKQIDLERSPTGELLVAVITSPANRTPPAAP
jgi:maltose operon protein